MMHMVVYKFSLIKIQFKQSDDFKHQLHTLTWAVVSQEKPDTQIGPRSSSNPPTSTLWAASCPSKEATDVSVGGGGHSGLVMHGFAILRFIDASTEQCSCSGLT